MITMAAGMAAAGLRPYVGVYSTFLQRAYDQLLHDVCLEALPVTPILDDGARFYVVDRNGYKVDYECRNNRMTCAEVPNLADFLGFAPCKILMSTDPGGIRGVQAQIGAALPDGLTVVQTAPFYLEVIPSTVNKGLGLRAACAAVGPAGGCAWRMRSRLFSATSLRRNMTNSMGMLYITVCFYMTAFLMASRKPCPYFSSGST